MRGSQKEALSTLASGSWRSLPLGEREFCLFWGHQPSEDGQLTKSCPQPVVDGGFLVHYQYLSLYGAVYDGGQGGALWR